MPDLEGQILKDRYRIEAIIGRGGMAEVYKAWDMQRHYYVAIKAIRQDLIGDAEFLHRFKQEARALASLSHANIVRFYSFEQEGPLAFIVMDYVAGISLGARLRAMHGNLLPLEEVALVARQLCAALAYAHAEGVLHLDIKPGNVMLQPDGTALLADFGIAQMADRALQEADAPGTAAYVSPEQCLGRRLDARSDVYSLGILLYEMLTGHRPFTGQTAPPGTGPQPQCIRWEQVHARPPGLRRHNLAVSQGLEAAVLRAMAKDPEQRYATPMQFWTALERASGPTLGYRPVWQDAVVREEAPAQAGRLSESALLPGARSQPVPTVQPRSMARRLPGWAWLSGGLLLTILLVAAVSSLPAGPRGGSQLASPTLWPAAGPTPVRVLPAPFVLCAEPMVGDMQTTFNLTVSGWEIAQDRAYRLTLRRPDGVQTVEIQLPDQLDSWSCNGRTGPGFRIAIKPEAGEMPGVWQIELAALPTGRQSAISILVSP